MPAVGVSEVPALFLPGSFVEREPACGRANVLLTGRKDGLVGLGLPRRVEPGLPGVHPGHRRFRMPPWPEDLPRAIPTILGDRLGEKQSGRRPMIAPIPPHRRRDNLAGSSRK